MSYNLWKYLFDDDVDSFRQYLARATYDRNASKGLGGAQSSPFRIGSPGHLGTSPKTPTKLKKTTGSGQPSSAKGVTLTRSDVNVRDGFGRTLLHHAVSSRSENATEFVKALLEIPLLDLYAQDTESGWTALHRALYFGNIAAAQALMLKDIQNATDYTTNVSHTNAGGLVKIKDHEGNSPFEVFGLTTAPRDLSQPTSIAALDAAETASNHSLDMDETIAGTHRDALGATNALHGDEVLAFGSNKNITLGLGDGDDRTYPERVQLKRSRFLVQHLFEEFKMQRRNSAAADDIPDSFADLQQMPTVITSKPIVIQDVVMSKLHTAILTEDPISNLHICGFGPGGRLGTGDEATRFQFTCIDSGGLGKRKINSIALGQDHTVAVCATGEVFTWGSNKFGQLGYELPEVSAQETPVQLSPRQIYGLIKKEQVIGAAASSLHSAIYTSTGLYTFGKNEGQLGLMDADARSLEVQTIPRRVGVSILQSPIRAVVAIDRATAVLLESNELIVFTNYIWTRVQFKLESFGSNIASDAFFARHHRPTKHICRITAGGNTIAALTTYGEVFAIEIPRYAEAVPPSKSTTNPARARNALPSPPKVWDIRKAHMAAVDVAVGQDGSVILCTAAGTVWKKEKRANIKSVRHDKTQSKARDYKFVRVPNVFGAVAVRSNAFGAFFAIHRDCDAMREQVIVGPPTLGTNVFELLAFKDFGTAIPDEESEQPQLRFWKPATNGPCPALIKRGLLTHKDAEENFTHLASRIGILSASDYDVWVISNITEVRIPVHSILLKARSRVLRRALAEFSKSYYFSIPDVIAIEYGADGQIQLSLSGADFLTLANFVLYLYTDALADVWRFTSRALHLAPRYRSIRTELMKIATHLEMKQLERAVRVIDDPQPCLRNDFESAFHDSDLFSDADVVIDLADGAERYAHSVILQSRCPFFEGLFLGHTGGMWMADRRNTAGSGVEPVHVDLKHIDSEVFELVLRHIYADTAEESFDTVIAKDLDEFIDIVIEVMAAANELMLDRLARVCQSVVGQFVTPWNVCGLLNTIAESSENTFKLAGLEYIGLNLENMLEQRLLEELDDYLLEELDDMVRSNQLAFMPFARSDRALEALLEEDATLSERLEVSRQRRLDAIRIPSRYVHEAVRPSTSSRPPSDCKMSSVTNNSRGGTRGKLSPGVSPSISAMHKDDLPFEMDDYGNESPLSSPGKSPTITPNYEAHDRPHFTRLESSQYSEAAASLETNSLSTTPRFQHSPSAALAAKSGPWAASTTPNTGLGFKDIMQQDSATKVSSLTQSLLNAASSSKQMNAKVSQKERKRQQHEQKMQMQAQVAAENTQSTTATRGLKDNTSSSPWQIIAPPKPVAKVQDPISSPKQTPGPQQNTKSSGVGKSIPISKQKQPPPNRSVSSPGMTGSSTAPPPQIQSIRHTPAPVRSTSWVDARTSMSDILAQQQFEKISIKENAAKRSLQDIQQEQEFQAWWDSESRKIQEEEAAAIRQSQSSGRGRGGGRKRGSGRGAAGSDNKRQGQGPGPGPGSGQAEKVTAETAKQNSARGTRKSRGRGRGGNSAQLW